jgi:3-deoxy-7-phosphoheptulonate synthase
MMIESHLHEGNQPLSGDPSALRYGVSITDGCIGWTDTETLLRDLAESLREPLQRRAAAWRRSA